MGILSFLGTNLGQNTFATELFIVILQSLSDKLK